MTPLRPSPPAALLVCLALLLAGCAERGADDAGPAGEGPEASSPEPGTLRAARFPGVERWERSVWANGTFEGAAWARPGATPARLPTAAEVVLDVTEVVPRGLPVFVVGEVRAEMTQGDVDLWFEAAPGERRNAAYDAPRGGYSRVQQGIVHAGGEPVTMRLRYDEAEPAPQVPYTLVASVAFDPEIVPAAFPIGVTLPPGGARMVVELVGEARGFGFEMETPNLMLWGPDDAFLGHFPLAEEQTTIDLPHGLGGEYVLVLSQGGRGARILTATAEPAALRALPQTFVVSEPQPGATTQRAEWVTTHERVPILAGVIFSPTTLSTSITVRLASPAGVLVEDAIEGQWVHAAVSGAPITTQFGWDSAYGVPSLAAGAYSVAIASEGAVGTSPIEARDMAAFWSR